jgi:hypothetical protein
MPDSPSLCAFIFTHAQWGIITCAKMGRELAVPSTRNALIRGNPLALSIMPLTHTGLPNGQIIFYFANKYFLSFLPSFSLFLSLSFFSLSFLSSISDTSNFCETVDVQHVCVWLTDANIQELTYWLKLIILFIEWELATYAMALKPSKYHFISYC